MKTHLQCVSTSVGISCYNTAKTNDGELREREKKTGCTSVVHSNGGGLDFYQCILGIMFHNFSCMLHSNWEFQNKNKKRTVVENTKEMRQAGQSVS